MRQTPTHIQITQLPHTKKHQKNKLHPKITNLIEQRTKDLAE